MQNNGAHVSAHLGKLLLLKLRVKEPQKYPTAPRWRILTERLCSGSALTAAASRCGTDRGEIITQTKKKIRMFLCTECDSRHLMRIRNEQRSPLCKEPPLGRGGAVGGMQLLNSLLSTGAQQRLQQRGQRGEAFEKSCWEMEAFGRRCQTLVRSRTVLVLEAGWVCVVNFECSKMSLVSSKWYQPSQKPQKPQSEMCIIPWRIH